MTAKAKGARSPLVIDYRAPSDLKPDPRNARTHPKRQLAQIVASITAFGFVNPILVDEESIIIAGHGRLLAAKQLSLETVPVITLPGLSDTERRALLLADNKIAQGAGWNMDLVKVELEALSVDLSFDLSVTGFSSGEIDVIISGDAGADPDDDVVPAPPKTPKTKPGYIWLIGEHRVGCGDVRDADFMGRVMGADTLADAAFLDPPYNVRIAGHANVRTRHKDFAMASGEMSKGQFTEFLTEAFEACASVSRPGAVHYACMDWRHLDEIRAAGEAAYGALLNLCIWNKSNAGMGSLYRSKHELVFVYRVGDSPHFNAVELGRHGRNRTNVWDYPSVNVGGSRSGDLDLHPTVKPVALVADAIQDVTRRGDVVLDAFLGSGTTLLAAHRTGRRFRGVELNPAYVDVALERLSAMTGLEPRLETVAEPLSTNLNKGAWGQ